MKIGLIASQQVTLDRFFSDWVDAWVSLGNEVHIALEEGQTSQLNATSITAIKGLTRRPSLGLVTARRALADWAARSQLDIALTNAATPSAMVRLSLSAVPVVYFCHGLHWRDPQDVPAYSWSLLENSLLGRTAGIVCMNNADEMWFRNRYSGPIIRLESGVGLCTDTWRRARPNSHSGALRLLWIGEFSARKRPMDALTVYRQLSSRGIPCELTMLGQGRFHEKVKQEVAPEESVILPGHVDPIPYLEQASLLFHTAKWEGFTRVLMEGVAMGVPTFGYSTKGVSDVPGVITAGRPGDTSALSNAIAHWFSNGQSRPEVVVDQFDWRISFESVQRLLESIVRH